MLTTLLPFSLPLGALLLQCLSLYFLCLGQFLPHRHDVYQPVDCCPVIVVVSLLPCHFLQ